MIQKDDQRRLVIAGTGHRPQGFNLLGRGEANFGYSAEAREALSATVNDALSQIQSENQGRDITIISGMALGYDQALAETALERGMHVIAAIPHEGQEIKWRPDAQRAYRDLLDRIIQRGGEVHIVSPGSYSATKMDARNVWMVDRAEMVLSLHSGSRGGTANCLAYAKSQDKIIKNIWQAFAENVQHLLAEKEKAKLTTPSNFSERINVVHVNTFKGQHNDSFIYIGRQNGAHGLEASPLANPFHIGPDGGRDQVIEKYQAWLREEFAKMESPARAELLRIKEVVQSGQQISLACWCAPQACHGDRVRDAIVKLIEREQLRSTATRDQISLTINREGSASVKHSSPNSGPNSDHSFDNERHADLISGDDHRVENLKSAPVLNSNRATQAHQEITFNADKELIKTLYEVTDGRSRAEHASTLNSQDQLARDQFEHGAFISDEVLVIPREFTSLPEERRVTTRQHAFSVISQFIKDENLAREKAEEFIELAEQICGRWMDSLPSGSKAKIDIYRNLYAQFTTDDHGRLLPPSERAPAFERTLETARVWAAEMTALEPVVDEEHLLGADPDFEHDEHQHSADELTRDENEVYSEIYQEAIERSVEDAEVRDHLEVEAQSSGPLPETAYERINLNELPPAIPDSISLDERERLLTETLPAVDRSIESGTHRDEIMRGIYSEIAREESLARDLKIERVFRAASGSDGRSRSAPNREELLKAYTTLQVLVSESLEKERSRFSGEVLSATHSLFDNDQSKAEKESRESGRWQNNAHPHMGLLAHEQYIAHQTETILAQQQLLRLDRIPTRHEQGRIELLEQALTNINGAIDRLAPTVEERARALDAVGDRADQVRKAESVRLNAYAEAEKFLPQIDARLQRPLAHESLRAHLQEEREQAVEIITAAQAYYLSTNGFIPEDSRQARASRSAQLQGLENVTQIVSDSRESLETTLSAGKDQEQLSPAFVSIPGRTTVRLPVSNINEHRAITTLAEACRIPINTWHGLTGGPLDGRNAERGEIARFISNYIDYRRQDTETKLLNESVEYRVYSERLDRAQSIEELRGTAKEIRRDNYQRGQQVKAHLLDPKTNPLPPRLDPQSRKEPSYLTVQAMQYLLTAQAPQHYTDEMREYRRALSISGQEKTRRVEALARGEIEPSRELSTLLEELGRRRTPAALSHYKRSLLHPPGEMERPGAVDLYSLHEKLVPYERDYLFRTLTDKHLAQQQERSRSTGAERSPLQSQTTEHVKEVTALKQLSQSEVFRNYYAAANWREAELFTAEAIRRTEGFNRDHSRSTLTGALTDRQVDSIGYVLHNFDQKKREDVANYLKQSPDQKSQLTGEVLLAFSSIQRETQADGRTEMSLRIPENSRLSDSEWAKLFDHLHPDNRAENRFLKERLPVNQLAEIRRDAQINAWTELEPQLRSTNYTPDSRVETLYRSLEIREALRSTQELQEKARVAHYALSAKVDKCVHAVEKRLIQPGRILSHETALQAASYVTRLGAFAGSFTNIKQIGGTLGWVSARLQESASASAHVREQNTGTLTERTLKDQETTRELVRASLDPAYAKANPTLLKEHSDQFNFIQHVVTPKDIKEYGQLQVYAESAKGNYLNSFIELDQRQQGLSTAKAVEQESSHSVQARALDQGVISKEKEALTLEEFIEQLHQPKVNAYLRAEQKYNLITKYQGAASQEALEAERAMLAAKIEMGSQFPEHEYNGYLQAFQQQQAQATRAPESLAAHDFQSEFEKAEQSLINERLETMIREGHLPERSSIGSETAIRDLLSSQEQREIATLAREAAWWNMVPAEIRGETSSRISTEVFEHALETSDLVAAARTVDKNLMGAREELAEFLSRHMNLQGPSQSPSTARTGEAHDLSSSSRTSSAHLPSLTEQKLAAESLLQALEGPERSELAEITERVTESERAMQAAFGEIDRSRESLDLARESHAVNQRIELFNEVRIPLESRMREYLTFALSQEGINAFRDPANAERHIERLGEAMRDCVEEYDLTLDDLNLRTEDVQEISANLVNSLSNTLEHNQNLIQAPQNIHDFSLDLTQSVEVLNLADGRLDVTHAHNIAELTAHVQGSKSISDNQLDLEERFDSRPGSVEREQAVGVRGMEAPTFDQDRVSDHLEHVHDLVEVLIH